MHIKAVKSVAIKAFREAKIPFRTTDPMGDDQVISDDIRRAEREHEDAQMEVARAVVQASRMHAMARPDWRRHFLHHGRVDSFDGGIVGISIMCACFSPEGLRIRGECKSFTRSHVELHVFHITLLMIPKVYIGQVWCGHVVQCPADQIHVHVGDVEVLLFERTSLPALLDRQSSHYFILVSNITSIHTKVATVAHGADIGLYFFTEANADINEINRVNTELKGQQSRWSAGAQAVILGCPSGDLAGLA